MCRPHAPDHLRHREEGRDLRADRLARRDHGGLVGRQLRVRPGVVARARDPQHGDARGRGREHGEAVPRVNLAVGVEHAGAGGLVATVVGVGLGNVLVELSSQPQSLRTAPDQAPECTESASQAKADCDSEMTFSLETLNSSMHMVIDPLTVS